MVPYSDPSAALSLTCRWTLDHPELLPSRGQQTPLCLTSPCRWEAATTKPALTSRPRSFCRQTCRLICVSLHLDQAVDNSRYQGTIIRFKITFHFTVSTSTKLGVGIHTLLPVCQDFLTLDYSESWQLNILHTLTCAPSFSEAVFQKRYTRLKLRKLTRRLRVVVVFTLLRRGSTEGR